MSLEEFDKEQLSAKDKGYIRMRSIMDLGMGFLWTAMGVFLVRYRSLYQAELLLMMAVI